ncbi:MAG: hypothetical protein ACK5D9_02555 [Burkholderiales bacterium]|jgi:hypothetical protein
MAHQSVAQLDRGVARRVWQKRESSWMSYPFPSFPNALCSVRLALKPLTTIAETM